MKETKPYLNAELSRDTLAREIGTNRQYLSDVIKMNTNMSFYDFLYHFRLEYARRLLLSDGSKTIETVYIESGFNNKSLFYRRFKQRYGMTPNEFKSMLVKKEA